MILNVIVHVEVVVNLKIFVQITGVNASRMGDNSIAKCDDSNSEQ